MKKIKNAAELRDARQQRKELSDKLREANKPEMSADETRAWNTLKSDWDILDTAITEFESAQERQSALDDLTAREERGQQPAPASQVPGKIPAELRSAERIKVFRNLGEQLIAVRNQALTSTMDERLGQVNAEARSLGNNESVGAEFGFVVQSDFTARMFESAAEAGDLLSRVDTYQIGANSDSAHWVDIDESDVSTTVFGGVQVYWAAEGKAVNSSKPEIRDTKLDLFKLMGFAYATEETLQDTNFASQLYNRAFGLAINRQLEGDIVSGNGIGKPLGMTQGGGLLAVAKETSQTADTVVYQNFVHMWGRLLPRLRKNAIWLMHPDVEEVLPLMTFPVGTGGVPVYLPAGGISGSPFSTLFGRPIVPSDHCAALGDQGDVILTDPKEYVMINKGGVQAASSIHVAFLTAENCFRFIMRANGAPKRKDQITIKNSTNKRSAYVTLAARA